VIRSSLTRAHTSFPQQQQQEQVQVVRASQAVISGTCCAS
jgi:hypothetical protein